MDLITLKDRDPPLSQEMVELREFYLREGPETINTLISSELPDNLRLHENDIRNFSVSLLLDTISTLLERWAVIAHTAPRQRTTTEQDSILSLTSDSGYAASSTTEQRHSNESQSCIAGQSTQMGLTQAPPSSPSYIGSSVRSQTARFGRPLSIQSLQPLETVGERSSRENSPDQQRALTGAFQTGPYSPYDDPVSDGRPVEVSPRLLENLGDLDINMFSANARVLDSEDVFEANWLIDGTFDEMDLRHQ